MKVTALRLPGRIVPDLGVTDLPLSIRIEVNMILRNEKERHPVERKARRSGDDPDGGGEVIGDSLRKRAGVHQQAFSDQVRRAGNRTGAHSAEEAAPAPVLESFSGKLRDKRLNLSWFENLWDSRRTIAA
jgi:hypothetical protein